MKRSRLAFLTSVLLALPAFAQDQCTDKPECWPEGSSMHTGLLLVQKQKQTDAALSRQFEELVQVVSDAKSSGVSTSSRLIDALGAQQKAWLSYRSVECELIGSLTGAGATWQSTYANQCELNHAELRLRRVRSALRCIKRIPADQRIFDQSNCLQQLAQLTNK
jgi:uncharacterized protein YecT (DUF1311 family)